MHHAPFRKRFSVQRDTPQIHLQMRVQLTLVVCMHWLCCLMTIAEQRANHREKVRAGDAMA